MASFRLLTSSLRPLMVLSAASPANLRLSLVQSARTLWSQSEFGSVLLRSSLNGSLEFRRHYQDKVTLKSKSFTEGGSSNRLYYLDLIEKYEGVTNCIQLAELSKGRRTHVMMSPKDAQILVDNLKLVQQMVVNETLKSGDEEVQDWISSAFPNSKFELKTKLSASGPWLKLVWSDSERTRMIFMDGSLVKELQENILNYLDSIDPTQVE